MLLPVLVALVLGAEVNAWFYMGWQLAAGCHMVSSAVAPVLLAEVARGEHGTAVATRSAVRTAVVLGAAAILATLVAGPVVIAVLGEAYNPALAVLLVMVAATVPDAVTGLAVARWRAERRERRAAVLNTVMAGITVVGAWLALPRVGGVGAAWAFLLAQSVGAVFVGVLLARDRRRLDVVRS
jgi:O-antigen/teichoic acid export membrane protein